MALLPQATNLVTVAVLVATTWWSGAQRPVEPAARAARAASTVTASAQPQPAAGAVTPAGAVSPWPGRVDVLARDGLQAVGYQPKAIR